jgi:hypothetical protein
MGSGGKAQGIQCDGGIPVEEIVLATARVWSLSKRHVQ